MFGALLPCTAFTFSVMLQQGQFYLYLYLLNMLHEEYSIFNGILYCLNQKWDPSANEYDSPSALIRPVMTQSLYRCVSPSQDGLMSTSSMLPPAEEVIRCTDQVTKRIQELWASMQDLEGRDTFVPCAERIRVAVAELIAVFPQVIY
jgi:hypothetical protein